MPDAGDVRLEEKPKCGLACSRWFVAEHQELIGFECEGSVGASLLVGIPHLEDAGSQDPHDSPYLSSVRTPFGQVPDDSYYVQDVYGVHHLVPRVPSSS